MNLNDFEKLIDRKIVARGRRYYEDGCVTSVRQTDAQAFIVQVAGTENYTVRVGLDDQQNVIDTGCDCPYDAGEFCKHQVAAFLAIRASLSDSALPSQPARETDRSLESVLSGQPQESLADFLLKLASESDEVGQRIRFEFVRADDQAELQESIRLIRSFKDRFSDRHGFVAYGQTAAATRGAFLVLDKARMAIKQNKLLHALELILCVLHEMMKLLENCDDSDGNVGDAISECLGLAGELTACGCSDQSVRDSLFSKLLAESGHKRYDGWTDWKLSLLGCCADLSDQPARRKKLEKKLSELVEDTTDLSWSSGYLKEQVNLIRYRLVLNNDGPQAADKFIMENLAYASFRRMAIEKAMQQKDFEAVIRLAIEGERKDVEFAGLINEWRKYRYTAYQLTGQLAKQRELAMSFILGDDFDFYLKLKKTYSPDEWRGVYPAILDELGKVRLHYAGVYTRAAIEEQEYGRLLLYVKRYPSEIVRFAQYLVSDFKEDVIALFVMHIEQTAENASNRRQYQDVCAIIRKLQKIGGRDRAQAVVENLMQKYARRPAMKEELAELL